MNLVEFLRARLDEDEQVAKAATPGPWRVDNERYAEVIYGEDDIHVVAGGRWGGESSVFETDADAIHIARHDPARVLAEVEAKRRIIELHAPEAKEPQTDAELHARFAHPAYEYATTEGQRKAWDDADIPPEGDGWERNIDAGRDGWERFDYTEESYWRRRLPEDKAPASMPPLTLRLLALPYADHPDYREEWRP